MQVAGIKFDLKPMHRMCIVFIYYWQSHVCFYFIFCLLCGWSGGGGDSIVPNGTLEYQCKSLEYIYLYMNDWQMSDMNRHRIHTRLTKTNHNRTIYSVKNVSYNLSIVSTQIYDNKIVFFYFKFWF